MREPTGEGLGQECSRQCEQRIKQLEESLIHMHGMDTSQIAGSREMREKKV